MSEDGHALLAALEKQLDEVERLKAALEGKIARMKLDRWAAGEAKTLDANAWRNLDRWDATGRHILSAHIARWGNEQASALLAHRPAEVTA